MRDIEKIISTLISTSLGGKIEYTSGKKGEVYVDLRSLLAERKGRETIKEIVSLMLDVFNPSEEVFVGVPTMGLILALVIGEKRPKARIAGVHLQKKKVFPLEVLSSIKEESIIMVDDVLNTGGTLKQGVEIVRKATQRNPTQIWVVVTYGIINNINGVEVKSLFSVEELLRKKRRTKEVEKALRWLKEYKKECLKSSLFFYFWRLQKGEFLVK